MATIQQIPFRGAFGGAFPSRRAVPLTRSLSSRPTLCSPRPFHGAGSRLAVMSEHEGEIPTPEQVAALLQVSSRTIEEWRRTLSGRRGVGWVATFAPCVARCWSGSRNWTPMARQKLRAGELGSTQVMELPSGTFQARVRLCDELAWPRPPRLHPWLSTAR